ncbi:MULTISPECIES: YtxH domain-containing protein [Vibrio]|uniref:YtxH domain-containing protein n=1 Tax=Vibrio algicola TaxID=2662262 RepID=A0A5Q0TGM8_9VIBR|nr:MULTISPECIES: YtxH domain-containing protein [Vibrio]MBD1577208.1 YtxH domain-containing protein [Vibrio sp. S11_S32]
MTKLIFGIILIAMGVGLGIKYQDPIMDMLNLRQAEEIQDGYEDAKDSLQSGMSSLSDTVSQLAQ